MVSSKNTFGDYQFEDWIPEHVREIIRDFWGQMGRTHQDWLESPCHQGISDICYHGPGPNGYRMPPNGATIDAYLTFGQEQWVEGRYIHCWNNIGRVIDKDGKAHFMSTGDRWVRIWQDEDEKMLALS